MTAAAEHALRTLGKHLQTHADKYGSAKVEGRIMNAMAVAHVATANQLQAEREAQEAKLRENPGGFSYDKTAGRKSR